LYVESRCTGDPSLRLKNAFARDDYAERKRSIDAENLQFFAAGAAGKTRIFAWFTNCVIAKS
jgi:hypothetical protein